MATVSSVKIKRDDPQRISVVKNRRKLTAALMSILREYPTNGSIAQVVNTIINNDNNHYAAVSCKDPFSISYTRNPEDKYDQQKRVKIRLGRYVKRQLKLDVSDQSLEALQNHLWKLVVPFEACFQVIRGDEIVERYRKEFGAHSCMTDKHAHFTSIYADNPEKVGLMCFERANQTGRALIWECDDGRTLFDRVYSTIAEVTKAMYQWADTQKLPSYQNQHDYADNPLVCTVKKPKNGLYPYCDTLYYVRNYDDPNQLTLSSHYVEGATHCMRRINGGIYDLCSQCHSSSERVTEHEGRMYCPDCGPRCTFCGTFYSDTNVRDQILSESHGRYIQVCTTCLGEHFRECDRCERLYVVHDLYMPWQIGDRMYDAVCRHCTSV